MSASRILQALSSALAGNALYFLLVSPRLPEAARHTPFALDIGLAIDFAICAAIYAAVHAAIRPRTGR